MCKILFTRMYEQSVETKFNSFKYITQSGDIDYATR